MLQKKKLQLGLALLFLLLIGLPLFIHLHWLPIRLWDESRLVANALEMYDNGNYVVTYYQGEPDLWNTKPPLMIWAQVACLKIFGINEFAIRFPSAVAAFFTCLLLVGFSYKAFKDVRLGILAALVLVSTSGYVGEHVSRSGDYDALLVLFTTTYCLSIFLYLQKGNLRYLHLFFLALSLCVLTKSIQGLMFLPAVALFVIWQKKALVLLQNKWLYINSLLFIAVSGSYFLLRESMNPGYLQAVWENDLGGRYVNDLVEGNRDGWYYFNYMLNYDYIYWHVFAMAGFAFGLLSPTKAIRDFSLYILLLFVFYFTLISTAQTKVPWYAAPLFPLLGFSAAITLYSIHGYLRERLPASPGYRLIPVFFLITALLYPYQRIVRKSHKPVEAIWDKEVYPISEVLQEAHLGYTSLDNHFVCYEDYTAHLLFYIRTLNDKGQKIDFRTFDKIEPGDTIIAAEPQVKARIEGKFEAQLLRQYDNVRIYKVLGPKANGEPARLMGSSTT